MYRCESWTIKKAEHWRIDAFELWCWRGLLRAPWTASSKEINPEYSLVGQMLKLKLQILWPSDVKSWLIRKDLDAGKDWRQEEKWIAEGGMVGWHHLLNGHEFEQVPGDGEGQGSLACCSPWGHKESDMSYQTTTTTTNNHRGLESLCCCCC